MITSAMPLQMTGFAPVVNSNSTGTVNFIVNICATGNIDITTILCLKELMWMTYSVTLNCIKNCDSIIIRAGLSLHFSLYLM